MAKAWHVARVVDKHGSANKQLAAVEARQVYPVVAVVLTTKPVLHDPGIIAHLFAPVAVQYKQLASEQAVHDPAFKIYPGAQPPPNP